MTWYVIRTQTGTEIKVEEAIKEIAADLPAGLLRAYCPKETRTRVTRGGRRVKRETIKLPLFPGYMFVAIVTDGGFHLVRATAKPLGFQGFLGERPNALPWLLPDKEVKKLRVAEANGDFDFTPKRKTFAAGVPLRICRGVFTGYKAKFLSERPDERIEVLMQAMRKGGAEYPTVLDREDVEAAA